jgi:hypothetical protein
MVRYFIKEDLDSAVRERDFAYLRDLVQDMHLAAECRQYLAEVIFDLLTGKVKRPRHRPRKESTRENKFKIAMRVLELKRRWPVEAAVKQAAKEFGCGDRKVYDSLKQFKHFVAHEESDDERAERQELHGFFTDEEWKDLGDLALEFSEYREPEPTEEEIEAAGDAYMDLLQDLALGK